MNTIETPRRRAIWNYRCKQCFAETPVYHDTELCYWCDPANQDEIAAADRRLEGNPLTAD